MGVKFTNHPTNILVTVLTLVMVFFMPLVDRLVSRKLRISLDDSLSENPEADRYLKIRKHVLIFIFVLYLLVVGYVTFFSRHAANDYLIHISFYQDLANSVKIDTGIIGFFRILFTQGPAAALSHIDVVNFDDLSQVYLNVVMFIPMGYLLPYVFDTFRKNIRLKATLASFLLSVLIENLQLITKLGFYDTDDILSNTLGGFIGANLYIMFAYFLTHPNFRQDMKKKFLWRLKSKKKAMFPFISASHIQRIAIFGSDKDEIKDFYENRLGLLLLNEVSFDNETYYLFDYNSTQIEIHCNSSFKDLRPQQLFIACNNSQHLRQSLQEHDIPISDYRNDPYTNLRSFDINAPDNVTITIIEE